jgi:uncharacterized protein YndB with AHSA1/START domain
MTDRVTFELDLPHPPAKVWRALTDPDWLSRWLLPVFGFDLAPGAGFEFRREPMPGWDGVVHCRVLDVEEPKKLRYSWVVGELDTVVLFTLTPTPGGTHLSMVQSGFAEHQKQNAGGERYGWRMMSAALVALLDAEAD